MLRWRKRPINKAKVTGGFAEARKQRLLEESRKSGRLDRRIDLVAPLLEFSHFFFVRIPMKLGEYVAVRTLVLLGIVFISIGLYSIRDRSFLGDDDNGPAVAAAAEVVVAPGVSEFYEGSRFIGPKASKKTKIISSLEDL